MRVMWRTVRFGKTTRSSFTGFIESIHRNSVKNRMESCVLVPGLGKGFGGVREESVGVCVNVQVCMWCVCGERVMWVSVNPHIGPRIGSSISIVRSVHLCDIRIGQHAQPPLKRPRATHTFAALMHGAVARQGNPSREPGKGRQCVVHSEILA